MRYVRFPLCLHMHGHVTNMTRAIDRLTHADTWNTRVPLAQSIYPNHTPQFSTNMMWPWSYNVCDRQLQPAQELSACAKTRHWDLHSGQGR